MSEHGCTYYGCTYCGYTHCGYTHCGYTYNGYTHYGYTYCSYTYCGCTYCGYTYHPGAERAWIRQVRQGLAHARGDSARGGGEVGAPTPVATDALDRAEPGGSRDGDQGGGAVHSMQTEPLTLTLTLTLT